MALLTPKAFIEAHSFRYSYSTISFDYTKKTRSISIIPTIYTL